MFLVNETELNYLETIIIPLITLFIHFILF